MLPNEEGRETVHLLRHRPPGEIGAKDENGVVVRPDAQMPCSGGTVALAPALLG